MTRGIATLVLVCAALLSTMSGCSHAETGGHSSSVTRPQLMHLRLANSVYVDPKDFFRIRPPEGWTMNEYRSDPRGKVDFNRRAGPKQVQLKVIGAANPFADFDALLQDCRNAVERLRARYGGTYRIETTKCAGTNAVLLLTSLPNGFKQYQVQLLAADSYYTLAYGTDKHLYDNYLPLAKAAMNTLEALPKGIKPDEARAHIVASKIRLARLFQGVGKNNWALTAVNEGLGVEASNAELRQLKQELEER